MKCSVHNYHVIQTFPKAISFLCVLGFVPACDDFISFTAHLALPTTHKSWVFLRVLPVLIHRLDGRNGVSQPAKGPQSGFQGSQLKAN